MARVDDVTPKVEVKSIKVEKTGQHNLILLAWWLNTSKKHIPKLSFNGYVYTARQ